MNLLALLLPKAAATNTWPRKAVTLADGRQILIAELSLDLRPEAVSALDDYENLIARAAAGKAPTGAVEITCAARRAIESLRENNNRVGVPFNVSGCRFTPADVVKMVAACYGAADLGKSSAPSASSSVGCAATSALAN